jgi:hypothetical protein
MIRELVSRDPAWRATRWSALLSAAGWPVPQIIQFGPFVIFMALFGAFPNRRATAFEAGLPIMGRDLVLARTVAFLLMIWISVFAGVAGLLLVKGSATPVGPVLAAGALCTLGAGICQSFKVKELAAPQWIMFPLWMLPPWAGPQVVDRTGAILPASCLLIGAALLARAWLAAPRSFELAPAEASGSAAPAASAALVRAGSGRSTSAFTWAPVLRSVFSWRFTFMLAFLGFSAAGEWLACTLWLVFAWLIARVQVRWLWALPLNRRALLWSLMGPIVLAEGLGYGAGLFGRHAPPKETNVMIVMPIAMLAYLLFVILCLVMAEWRRLAYRFRKWFFSGLALTWYASFMWLVFFSRFEMTMVRDALVHFARVQPLSPQALAAASLAALILVYMAVEKVFGEPEFADKPKARNAAEYM